MCESKHEGKGHNKAYFGDKFVYECGNYENIEQISANELQKKARLSADCLPPKNRSVEPFNPNFELYHCNEVFSKDQVQIKVLKDFPNQSEALRRQVMLQINNCRVSLNHCRGGVATKLLEHLFVSNNLYLVSQATDSVTLAEYLPYLLDKYQDN